MKKKVWSSTKSLQIGHSTAVSQVPPGAALRLHSRLMNAHRYEPLDDRPDSESESPSAPPLVFDRDSIREVDRTAIKEYGIPGIVLMENAARVGAHLKEALERALEGHPGLKEVRGQGLMIGVELTKACSALTQRAADKGLLISVTADNVIRLVPPLIMTTAEADEVVSVLVPLIEQFLAE